MSWILNLSSSKIMDFMYKGEIQIITVVSLFSTPSLFSDPTYVFKPTTYRREQLTLPATVFYIN